MEDTQFIPYSVTGLYEKMMKEQFRGVLSREEDELVWKLPNGVIVRASAISVEGLIG